MKRTICILLTALLLLGALSGCQKTPDEPIVVEKNLDQLLEKAQATADVSSDAVQSEETPTEDKQDTIVTNLGAPESLKEEIVSAKGKLHVYTDATISLPQADTLPITRVKMSCFTNDTAERIVETLFTGAQTISDDLSLLPKAYYDNIVKDLIANKDNDIWFSERYSEQIEFDDALASAMQSAESAPTDPEYQELQYHFDDAVNENSFVHYYALREDYSMSRIDIYTETGLARLRYFRNPDDSCLDLLLAEADQSPDTTSVTVLSLNTTQMQALALAENALQKMGFDEFICSGMRMHAMEDIEPGGVYEFMFTRAINGIAVTYTDDDGGDRKILHENETFASPWLYEKIRIFVDDDGIAMFEYNSPQTVEGTEVAAATLLPFSEIQAIFEKMIVIVDNDYDTSDEGVTCEYYIDHITLGLMRLTEKDVGSQGLIIPVWDFFGYSVDSYGITRGTSGYISLLTINAIDGSIIDRWAGY